MTTVVHISTALPPYRAENKDILNAAARWLEHAPAEFKLFERFLASSHTDYRNFIMPPGSIVDLPGSEGRAMLFEQHAPKLSFEAVRTLLDETGTDPGSIDAIISTSCSCPLIPAPDTYLFEQFEFRRDVVRIPCYQYGCAGGVIGLGLANRLQQSLKNVLVVSTELCSLVFQPSNTSAAHLVGAAIFGDGAAAALLHSDGATRGITLHDHRSYLLPETRHLMGYDIRDTGSHLRLDKELPGALIEAVPRLTAEFLGRHGLSRKDIDWWLFHPGGAKILSCLDEALSLRNEQSRWAGDILRSVGNLSSATVLFVMQHFMNDAPAKAGDKVVVLGVGPGLTVEMLLGTVS